MCSLSHGLVRILDSFTRFMNALKEGYEKPQRGFHCAFPQKDFQPLYDASTQGNLPGTNSNQRKARSSPFQFPLPLSTSFIKFFPSHSSLLSSFPPTSPIIKQLQSSPILILSGFRLKNKYIIHQLTSQFNHPSCYSRLSPSQPPLAVLSPSVQRIPPSVTTTPQLC